MANTDMNRSDNAAYEAVDLVSVAVAAMVILAWPVAFLVAVIL